MVLNVLKWLYGLDFPSKGGTWGIWNPWGNGVLEIWGANGSSSSSESLSRFQPCSFYKSLNALSSWSILSWTGSTEGLAWNWLSLITIPASCLCMGFLGPFRWSLRSGFEGLSLPRFWFRCSRKCNISYIYGNVPQESGMDNRLNNVP